MILMVRALGLLLLFLNIVLAQTPVQVGTASISGQVLVDGKPAADVLITLRKNEHVSPAQSAPPPRTTTDASGQYRFSGLPAGKYFVRVVAQGYVNASRSKEEGSGSVTLGEGDAAKNLDFKLVKSGVITGRVLDEQGRPVIEEVLLLYRLEQDSKKVFTTCSGQTDDRGVYRCFDLLPGKYLVGAGRDEANKEEAAGYYGSRTRYARSWYPNSASEDKARVIELMPGSEVSEIDLRLSRRKKGVKVSGKVMAADTSKPMQQVMVGTSVVNDDNQTMGFSGSADSFTDALGEFRLPGLLPGKYKLTPMMFQGGEYFGEPVTIEVGTEEISGLELKMERGSVVSGVAVLEDPGNREAAQKLSKLMLAVVPMTDGGWQGAPSQSLIGADGSFQFKGVRPGKVSINFINYGSEVKGFSITRLEQDGVSVNDGIEVKAGENAGVRVVLGYGSGSIIGELKIENGPLPQGVGLHLKGSRAGAAAASKWVEVDARNRFAIEGLTTGTYELTVETHATQPPWNKPSLQLQGIKQTVEVTNGQEAKITLTVDLSGKGGGK